MSNPGRELVKLRWQKMSRKELLTFMEHVRAGKRKRRNKKRLNKKPLDSIRKEADTMSEEEATEGRPP